MRTPARNWKYGQTDVNVLLLAVIWRGVAIPLLYELLPHGGGSHTEIRHTLMDDALCLLRAADIRVLYADRAFVGYDWIQGLARRGIPICVRLRRDTPLVVKPIGDRHRPRCRPLLCRIAFRTPFLAKCQVMRGGSLSITAGGGEWFYISRADPVFTYAMWAF